MSAIQALGYIGFEVSDLAAWRGFASDFVGLEWQDADADGVHHLRLDSRASRLQLREGAADDLAYTGWEVGGPQELAGLAERLREAGISVEAGTPELAARRRVAELISFQDPDGLVCEAFYGALARHDAPVKPGRPVNGFVTEDGGLGHVILNVRDVGRARAFYEGVLGFRLTDFIRFEPLPGFKVDLTFLRCNGRHHTVALASFPFPKRMQHLMLQYAELDDVGLAYDQALKGQMPITLTLGRHSNDHMVSFYVRSPSGFEFELGWGAIEVVEPSWSVQLHHHQSVWGHLPGPGLTPPPGFAPPGSDANAGPSVPVEGTTA
jgi:2,3-dihydroxybiphenyl 1,2-dioxygenase